MNTSMSKAMLMRNVTCCSYIVGVILQTKVPAFEIMLWRMFSWNIILRVKPLEVRLEDPQHVSCRVD
jgi:hypothetical protein